MPQIKFSHNWNNKLDNNVFITIRSWSVEKDKYYLRLVGREFEVVLNGKIYGCVVLKDVITSPFNRIESPLLSLDTGMTDEKKIRELFRDFGIKRDSDTVLILVFEKAKVSPSQKTGTVEK